MNIMRRVIGLDVGDRRIGISISDPLGITAQWLTVLERTSPARDLATVAELAQERDVQAVVVGLPITMEGDIGEQAKKVMVFVEALRAKVTCPVHVVDERLTTAQSEKALLETDTPRKTRKRLIDQLAAQLILQHYLDVKHQRV